MFQLEDDKKTKAVLKEKLSSKGGGGKGPKVSLKGKGKGGSKPKVDVKKPKVDEIKNYCIERNNNIDPEAFYDFYQSKDWYVGKSKMKDWKAAIRNWERSDKKKSKPNTMSKIHQHLQKNINVKEKLKQKFKK